ncbi:SPOR domain-containing protein [Candidatus Binatus sp.]|uniref:SPOR domain-containing protein n=1 Tax=Candidatus Binatus sp. TaxID=2811406 RepID=UPI003C39BB23
MRFEIRAGGAFLILLGLVGLSGAVFALGLVAGYEMARQNQPDLNQISSTYPLPNPPASGEKPAPVTEMSPAAAASPSVASAPAPPSVPIQPPAPAVGEIPPAARTSPATVARLKPPPEAPTVNRPAPDDESKSEEDSETASAPAAPAHALAPGAKPYNIQIEAVMDKSGADEMVSRLKTLGYSAQEIKVALNGQTWYRVRIGPYASADEANAAQNKLREQYRQAYTTSH